MSSSFLIEAMEEDPDSNMLSGAPATQEVVQQTVFVNTGPNYNVQKNSAAMVIGILVIIWGAFNLLGSPFAIFSDYGATDLQGNPISYPTEYFVVTIITGISVGGLAVFGGYQITKYKKKGIWITFGAFAIAWIGSIISSTIQGSAMDTESLGLGAGLGVFSGVCGIFCYAICGLIVAIPLMLSDGGME